MVKRTITGLIALPIFLFFALKGGNLLFAGTLGIALIGLMEFYNAFKSKELVPNTWLGMVIGVLIIVGIYLELNSSFYLGILFLFVLMLLAKHVFSKKENLIGEFVTFFGVSYVVLGFGHLLLLSKLDIKYIILIPFFISWSTDTAAYFSGVLFGKRKLIPSVSPNKTVEGAIGGVIGAVILTSTFSYLFIKELFPMIMIITLVGSVLSQIGDLMASKIKRDNDVKDYGKVLPGHGGILDRFDSVLITVPYVYYATLLFMFLRG